MNQSAVVMVAVLAVGSVVDSVVEYYVEPNKCSLKSYWAQNLKRRMLL